jgi:hypothetical protein
MYVCMYVCMYILFVYYSAISTHDDVWPDLSMTFQKIKNELNDELYVAE